MTLFELNQVVTPLLGLIGGVIGGSRGGIAGSAVGGLLGLVVGIACYYLLTVLAGGIFLLSQPEQERKPKLWESAANLLSLAFAFSPPYVAAYLSWLAAAKIAVSL